MIRFHCNWIKLQIKQTFRSISFYLLLIMILSAVGLSILASRAADDQVRIMVLCEDTRAGERIKKELVEEEYSGFVFVDTNDEEELVRRVRSGDASCGLVLRQGLDEAIEKGQFDDEITFYHCAESIHGYTVKDVVFPVVLRACSGAYLARYIREHDRNVPDDILRLVLKENEEYLDNASIKIFSRKIMGEKADTKIEQGNRGYGLLLWLLFVALILGAGDISIRCRAYFGAHRLRRRLLLRLEAVFVYAVLLGTLCSMVYFREKLPVTILFLAISSIWACIFVMMTGSQKVYDSLIPAVALISLMTCPVIYDFSVYFPAASLIGHLFPITWFV